jgi:hypothetical protein
MLVYIKAIRHETFNKTTPVFPLSSVHFVLEMAETGSTVSVKQNRKRYGLLFGVAKAIIFKLKLLYFGT